jgi:predicted nucleic acid-binding protein
VLVVDASIACAFALRGERPSALQGEELVAPHLLWSESTSALHELAFRGELDPATSSEAIERLRRLDIAPVDDPRIQPEASRVARRLGWAKTYDAEYVALASLMGAALLTLDARLARAATRLVSVVAPADLQAMHASGPPKADVTEVTGMLATDDPQ